MYFSRTMFPVWNLLKLRSLGKRKVNNVIVLKTSIGLRSRSIIWNRHETLPLMQYRLRIFKEKNVPNVRPTYFQMTGKIHKDVKSGKRFKNLLSVCRRAKYTWLNVSLNITRRVNGVGIILFQNEHKIVSRVVVQNGVTPKMSVYVNIYIHVYTWR